MAGQQGGGLRCEFMQLGQQLGDVAAELVGSGEGQVGLHIMCVKTYLRERFQLVPSNHNHIHNLCHVFVYQCCSPESFVYSQALASPLAPLPQLPVTPVLQSVMAGPSSDKHS